MGCCAADGTSGGHEADRLELAGGDALAPFGRAGDVLAGAARIHRHGDGHVHHVELVDRFHAEVFEADHLRGLDGLADEVGGAAHGHQVGRLVLLDRLDGDRAALGLADHRDQAGFGQHHVGELVHARGRGRACRAHGLVAHRIDRADVVDDAVGEIDGQLLAPGQHVLDALVRCIAAGEHLAVQQQRVAGLPARDLFARERVEVDAAALVVVGCPVDLRPQVQRRGLQVHGAGAVEHEVRMARGGAVGDHGHGLGGRVRGVHLDLDVQHGGEAAQALRADAQGVDLVEQLQAQFLHLVELLAARGLGLQLVHVQVVHQAFLGEQHGLFRRAADADAQHARRAPAGTHGGHGLEHPVHQVVAGVHHDHLGLVLAAAALGRDGDVHGVAGHDLREDHGGRVVLRVLAQELRVGHDARAQGVVRVVVAAAHAFVDGVFQALAGGEAFPAHVHADLQEHVDDAGVLADGALAGGAHLAVGKDLRHRVLGRRALLALVGTGQVGDEVGGMVVADVLQGRGDGFHEVVVPDGGAHGGDAL